MTIIIKVITSPGRVDLIVEGRNESKHRERSISARGKEMDRLPRARRCIYVCIGVITDPGWRYPGRSTKGLLVLSRCPLKCLQSSENGTITERELTERSHVYQHPANVRFQIEFGCPQDIRTYVRVLCILGLFFSLRLFSFTQVARARTNFRSHQMVKKPRRLQLLLPNGTKQSELIRTRGKRTTDKHRRRKRNNAGCRNVTVWR